MSEEKKLLIEYAENQLAYFIREVEKTIIKINKLEKQLEESKNKRKGWRKVLEELK